MDPNIMEIIEEFMESALAQWVRHLSFIPFIFEKRSSFSEDTERRINVLKV